MPLKLIPPRPGKTPFYSVRGTHLGTYLDRSTKSAERATAAKLLKAWKDDIERDALARPGEPTFVDAAVAYIAATGNDEFLERITEHLGKDKKPLRLIDQQVIDNCAITLYPGATAATRNRNCYTPISAVLKHSGVDFKIKRPKGWRGNKRTDWMEPEQAFRLMNAAREVDLEFGIFLMTLLYAGPRLGEVLGDRFTTDKVNLPEAFAYIGRTKNGDPRAVFLPPVLVAALASHPRGMDRRFKIGRNAGKGQPVFRFRKNGRLYTLMGKAKKLAGADLGFVTFHIIRHTWATWMRRYAGLDLHGLVATEAWADPASAARYAHVVASEESQKAVMLPVEKTWKARARIGIASKIKGR
jgi:integrase